MGLHRTRGVKCTEVKVDHGNASHMSGVITMACGSPGGGRARGAGVRKAAAIAAATSSRMRPRTAVSDHRYLCSDMAIGVAPVAVAGGGEAEREVPGSSTIERRGMGSSQKVKQQNNR